MADSKTISLSQSHLKLASQHRRRHDDDDDDFQEHPSHSLPTATIATCSSNSLKKPPLKPQNDPTPTSRRRPKKPKHQTLHPGKENRINNDLLDPQDFETYSDFGLESIPSSIDFSCNSSFSSSKSKIENAKSKKFFSNNSIESRLIKHQVVGNSDEGRDEDEYELDLLLKLCSESDEVNCPGGDEANDEIHQKPLCLEEEEDGLGLPICCPLCGADISDLSDEDKQMHTNECLDKQEAPLEVAAPGDDTAYQCPGQVLDSPPVKSPKKGVNATPVLEWLRNLGLAKYEEIFAREEIDWDSLKWLTEEDLYSIGVTALGPRKKIVHALRELRDCSMAVEMQADDCSTVVEGNDKQVPNKLITDYFPGSADVRQRSFVTRKAEIGVSKRPPGPTSKKNLGRHQFKSGKHRDVPPWCFIPGTPFRVDAFKHLRRDCSHWFLTHFHADHYQGLTKSFSHGKIYCSSITAKLVNLKIGIPYERIQVLPLNQKTNVAGIDVTCFDANHCPGSIIILFELADGEAVLHTGDFRFSEEMERIYALQTCRIGTLILDTTYCDPQYDFPKQEAVIQFVIEAIQVEAFNPRTLFLIGSYTIGKERLFLEIARVLHKKIFVTATKLRILECLELSREDMQWFTLNEHESQIHVVPMWSLASFKRLKHISNQYSGRFDLIVAFSPTGWTFGKGKKRTPGKRWQQGTIIRYEVPYSEHSSFSELKEFVKFISPRTIIPSVNNHGPESSNAMVSHLLA